MSETRDEARAPPDCRNCKHIRWQTASGRYGSASPGECQWDPTIPPQPVPPMVERIEVRPVFRLYRSRTVWPQALPDNCPCWEAQ